MKMTTIPPRSQNSTLQKATLHMVPISSSTHKRRLQCKRIAVRKNLGMAHKGLASLQNLVLPPPYNQLLPPAKLQLKGDPLACRRIHHSKLCGHAWWSVSEINMLLAPLLRGGRYNKLVCIFSTGNLQLIIQGYNTHIKKYENEAIIIR
jgi:hypothetical protein